MQMKFSIDTGSFRLTKANRMTLEKEYELIALAQQGNQTAINELVHAHTGLVVKYCRKCTLKGNITFDDLYQEGIYGLIYAIGKFDMSTGNRFSTYATHWIRATCYRAMLYQDQVVDLPADYTKQIKEGKIEKVASDSIDNVCNDKGETFAEFFSDDHSLDWELQIESNDRMTMLLECLKWVDEIPRKLIMEIIIKGRPVKDVCAEYGLRVDTQRDYVISGLEELKVPLRKLYGIHTLKECFE